MSSNLHLFKQNDEQTEKAKEKYLKENRDQLIQFMRERPNVFGKIDVENMSEKQEISYVEQKFAQIMDYTAKEFYSIIENK